MDREEKIAKAGYESLVDVYLDESMPWAEISSDGRGDWIRAINAAVAEARRIDYDAEKPLTFGLDGDCLVISIGIKTLAGAAETCDGLWDGDRDPPYVTIKDFKAFAAAIAMELDERQADPEGNDGLDRLLDRAIVQVIGDGFEYDRHEPNGE